MYTEHFRAYKDLGNQGATNAGKNVRYIPTWAVVTINVGLAQARPNYVDLLVRHSQYSSTVDQAYD